MVVSGEPSFEDELSSTPPAITGGLLGSFWKQKKKQERSRGSGSSKKGRGSGEGDRSPGLMMKGRKGSSEPRVPVPQPRKSSTEEEL
jgi:hypothetical protein